MYVWILKSNWQAFISKFSVDFLKNTPFTHTCIPTSSCCYCKYFQFTVFVYVCQTLRDCLAADDEDGNPVICLYFCLSFVCLFVCFCSFVSLFMTKSPIIMFNSSVGDDDRDIDNNNNNNSNNNNKVIYSYSDSFCFCFCFGF